MKTTVFTFTALFTLAMAGGAFAATCYSDGAGNMHCDDGRFLHGDGGGNMHGSDGTFYHGDGAGNYHGSDGSFMHGHGGAVSGGTSPGGNASGGDSGGQQYNRRAAEAQMRRMECQNDCSSRYRDCVSGSFCGDRCQTRCGEEVRHCVSRCD